MFEIIVFDSENESLSKMLNVWASLLRCQESLGSYESKRESESFYFQKGKCFGVDGSEKELVEYLS